MTVLGPTKCTGGCNSYFYRWQFKGFVVLRAVRAVDTCKTKGKKVYASLIDKNFEKNWTALENQNIVRGAYHFFAPDVSAEIQFEAYKKAVDLKKGDLPPILDVENHNCNMNEAMKWMKLAKDYYKVDPILYSEYFFYKIYLKNKNHSYPLWLSMNEGSMMRPYFKDPDCLFWQNKIDKYMTNFQEKVDYNVFLGDSTEFKKILIQ